MNRGELRVMTNELCEDAAQKTYPTARVDRQINLSAQWLTSRLARTSIIRHDVGIFEFTASGDAAAGNPIEDPDRFMSPIQLYRKDNERVRGFLIPEGHKDRPEYRVGLTAQGYCYFIRHNASAIVNEVQQLAITGGPGTGTWTVAFNGSGASAGTLGIAPTAAQVQAALESLSTIGAGNVVVTGTAPTFSVAFRGSLAGKSLPLIVCADTFNVGDVVVTQTTDGDDKRKIIYFVSGTDVGSPWVLRYQKSTLIIGAGDLALDHLTYDTLPQEWDYLIAYRAAVALLGIHNDVQQPLVADYSNHLQECLAQMTAAQPRRRVRQELWRY